MKRDRAPFESFPIAWVALAAAVIGACVAVALPIAPHLNPDSLDFEAVARSLLAGRGFSYHEAMFPSLTLYAFRAPGYCAFLALGLWLGGRVPLVAMQGALNGLTSALTGGIAGRLGGARAAWIAFAIRLLWPVAWWHAGQYMSELFFEFLTVLATWVLVEALERRRTPLVALSGVIVGLAILTRPVGAGLALALGLWTLWRRPRAAIAFALAVVVVWAPWPIRNYRHLHAFVPLTTIGGVVEWVVHSGQPTIVAWNYMQQHWTMGEISLDRHFHGEAMRIVRGHPLGLVRDFARSAFTYLGPIRGRGRELWLHRFTMLAALPALLMAAWRRRLALPFMIWAAQGVLLCALIVDYRYRFPTEWCVVIAGGCGIAALAERYGGRPALAAATAALALSVAGTLIAAR